MLIIFWIFFPNFAGWTFKNIYLKPPSSCSVIIWGTLSKFNSRKRPAPSPSATELPLMHHAIVMFHLMGRHHRCPQHFGHAKYDISTIGVLQSGLSNKKYSIKMLEKGHRIHLQTTFSYIYIHISETFPAHSVVGIGIKTRRRKLYSSICGIFYSFHNQPFKLNVLNQCRSVSNTKRRYIATYTQYYYTDQTK